MELHLFASAIYTPSTKQVDLRKPVTGVREYEVWRRNHSSLIHSSVDHAPISPAQVLKALISLGFISFLVWVPAIAQSFTPPNVILVMTDDQGIGDIGCHGNPWIQTPNLDAFYQESVRMTDFHVSPLCTPTRAALMTGLYPINNGAWATYQGRDALSEGVFTMADLFKANGYVTGMFGKWHLGDNYPVRPTDCGFDVAIHHKAGGVGELSDHWGNSYFNDVYYVNNKPKAFEGYCTDVWFRETMAFIDSHQDRPFFAYLATNAPHSPLIVAEKYAAPYRAEVGKHIYNAEFYGMITNIDENFGKLDSFLHVNDLADNTILIFMTDNGSGNGVSKDGSMGYNYGLTGKKGSKFEGGHRVPFFIRWKDGQVSGGKDLSTLTAHIDLIPTLAGLCQLAIPSNQPLDGIDFSSLLLEKQDTLAPRTVFIHHRQDWRPPMETEQSCLLSQQWRLLNGQQLFDLDTDSKQTKDLSQDHPSLVSQLNQANQAFVEKAKKQITYQELPYSILGNPAQPEITLTIQHAIGEDRGIWKAEQICAGLKNKNNTHALGIEKEGKYLISCRRWPKECAGPIWGVPKQNPKNQYDYTEIHPQKIRISIANQIHEQTIQPDQEAVEFEVSLPQGKTLLVNEFVEKEEAYGVYYTYIRYLGEAE